MKATTIAEGGVPCGQRSGGKGWQGEDNDDHSRMRSRVFVRMNDTPHTTKFQDLPRQTAMPDPPLHGEG
jgi:hypothetical protein